MAREIDRREFIQKTGLAAVAYAATGGGAFGIGERATPANVLFLISDDHAAYVCGAYGNDRARTPNLDNLAGSGVRFTNAFVNCPMCTASRQSFLTGRLPHSIGVTQLPTALPAETTTLAELLKPYGYTTAAIGKMHFNSDLRHGFDFRLDLAEHRAYQQLHPARPLPDNIEVLPPWRPFKDPAAIWLNGSYLPFGAYDEDMPGTWFARKAQEYLRQSRDQPFFLITSFYEPHSPFHFPIEYRGMYEPASFDVPEAGPEDDWQIPEIFRDLTRSEKQHIIASNYTSVAYMDKNVGLVLETLKETGLDKNTLVIYIGDHGYNLGHHGRFEKHCSYDQAVRAPLIVRLPGASESSVVDSLAEFIDIFPTIAEVCAVPVPDIVEGKSLLPLIEGTESDIRDVVFSEYLENEEAMVRTQRYKFVYITGKRERQDGYKTGRPLPGRMRILFDILNDPNEFINLADRPEYRETVDKFQREMLRRFAETSPARAAIPSGLSVEDQLDYYLQPRDGK